MEMTKPGWLCLVQQASSLIKGSASFWTRADALAEVAKLETCVGTYMGPEWGRDVQTQSLYSSPQGHALSPQG